MGCDMCGADTRLVTALVEGVELSVCKQCSKYGKIVRKPRPVFKKKGKVMPKKPERELIQAIVSDYAQLIRKKREKMGLKQKEFALALNERESIVNKLESGTYEPSLNLARKLEKVLKIKLVETKEVLPQDIKVKKTTYTIGDMIKVK